MHCFHPKFAEYKANGTFLRNHYEINYDSTILLGLPQNEAQAHVAWFIYQLKEA